MRAVFALLIVTCSIGSGIEASAQSRMGQLAGYQSVNQKMQQRLFSSTALFSLTTYLADPSLTKFLGQWERSGGASSFSNGVPNALNGALWQVVMTKFAEDVGSICRPDAHEPPGGALRSDFKEVVQQLCHWDQDADRAQVLERLWSIVMQFDAPYDEFIAWQTFWLGQENSVSMHGSERVVSILKTVLLSADFLLERN